MTYYKILNNGKSPYANFDYTEYLPKNSKPGKWLPKFDKLELCRSGYHVTDAEHLIDWIDGNQLFEVEVKGKTLKGDNKTTCQKIRLVRQVEGWNDKNLRFFAFWCAEQALPIYEEKYPDDNRPRRAIETARRYAEGLATEGELAAARATAWAAAMVWDAAAARAAAWAAAMVWDAAAARAAAMAAARAAAWAAGAAARAAAWDAAWDAARDAARDAAWAAAWDAAWDAARDAASAAVWDEQSIKLQKIVFEESENE